MYLATLSNNSSGYTTSSIPTCTNTNTNGMDNQIANIILQKLEIVTERINSLEALNRDKQAEIESLKAAKVNNNNNNNNNSNNNNNENGNFDIIYNF
jgi:hypothetical protein